MTTHTNKHKSLGADSSPMSNGNVANESPRALDQPCSHYLSAMKRGEGHGQRPGDGLCVQVIGSSRVHTMQANGLPHSGQNHGFTWIQPHLAPKSLSSYTHRHKQTRPKTPLNPHPLLLRASLWCIVHNLNPCLSYGRERVEKEQKNRSWIPLSRSERRLPWGPLLHPIEKRTGVKSVCRRYTTKGMHA
jgi:hypothetical protein